MITPKSTLELCQQLTEQGFKRVYLIDVEDDRKQGIGTMENECVTVWYYIKDQSPEEVARLVTYLESVFHEIERGGGLPGNFEEISLPKFPYDETWLQNTETSAQYHEPFAEVL